MHPSTFDGSLRETNGNGGMLGLQNLLQEGDFTAAIHVCVRPRFIPIVWHICLAILLDQTEHKKKICHS